jgi:hypothetical protein
LVTYGSQGPVMPGLDFFCDTILLFPKDFSFDSERDLNPVKSDLRRVGEVL